MPEGAQRRAFPAMARRFMARTRDAGDDRCGATGDIHRLPAEVAADLLAQADHRRFGRADVGETREAIGLRPDMQAGMHVHAGGAGAVHAQVGMQQRREPLEQGEQRDEEGVTEFHPCIIGSTPHGPV